MNITITSDDMNFGCFALRLPFTFEIVGADIAGTTKMHGVTCKALFRPSVSNGSLYLKLDEVDAAGLPIAFLVRSFVLSQIIKSAKALPPLVSLKEVGEGIVLALAGLCVMGAAVQDGAIVLDVTF